MLAITIDDGQPVDGCYTCCCESVSLRPGETQPLHLNYAPWALPIAGHGLHCNPIVDVEEKDTCPTPGGSNLPPHLTGLSRYYTTVNGHLDANLRSYVVDPEGAQLIFKLLQLYGPKHGKLVLQPSGAFSYTPVANFKGADRFYASASDGVSDPLVFETMIAVGIEMGIMVPTPDFHVGVPLVDQRFHMVTLPLVAAPSAKPCQVFRLNIRQGAMDCNCNCYYHLDCVDVRIAKC
jgi:hypothetical protein